MSRKYQIDHAYDSGSRIEYTSPDQLKGMQSISGVYTRSGEGYCTTCAEFIDPSEIDSYETHSCAMILCENCGGDTN